MRHFHPTAVCGLFIFIVAGGFLPPASVVAQSGAGAPDSLKLLQQADALVTFADSDFSGVYTFVQENPGQGTSTKQAMVFRRDRENTYLIVIVKPEEDKGKGYLKSGNNTHQSSLTTPRWSKQRNKLSFFNFQVNAS